MKFCPSNVNAEWPKEKKKEDRGARVNLVDLGFFLNDRQYDVIDHMIN